MSRVYWYCFVFFDVHGFQFLIPCLSSCLIHDSVPFMQSTDSRDLCTSSSHSAEIAERRDTKRSLTISSIPEEVSSMPFDDRSGWILDPPSFIHANVKAAPRSLDMDENRLVLQMKPSSEVLELSAVKAANHELPHHGTRCVKAQNDDVAYTSAFTDFSLVQVCNSNFFLIYGSMSV
jgi:hypothetical protein